MKKTTKFTKIITTILVIIMLVGVVDNGSEYSTNPLVANYDKTDYLQVNDKNVKMLLEVL